jgi:hypothetical protein
MKRFSCEMDCQSISSARASALAMGQGRTKATFADFSAFYREGPRRAAPGTATSTSSKALPTASSISPAEMALREWLRQHFRAQDRHAGHADHP